VRREVAKHNLPSLPALKAFFDKHRKRTDTDELGQYISFALSAEGPPHFAIKPQGGDIPPDVGGLVDLPPLLAAFYKEAGIEDLWKRSQSAIDGYVMRYHAPVSETVLQTNAYLRQQTSGFRGRHFQIFVELLAAPNQVQTRSYGNEYTVVVTPSPDLRIFDIRHGYLHYLLDPLALRHHEVLERKKALGDHAQRARALPESYKEDFAELTTESLIKAVEARLDRKPDAVQQALREGFILAPYFAEQLTAFEKQEQAMVLYYPAMVSAIDLYKEEKRLAGVDFNSTPAVRAVKAAPPPAPAPLTGAAKTLEDAEQLYTTRDLDPAKKRYLEVLEQTDQKPMHAAAYYGLARIAVLQRDPETADRLFRKSLEQMPEPVVRAWDLVYLGKLSLAASERESAAEFFEKALQVEGASEKAREEAQKGLQQSRQ